MANAGEHFATVMNRMGHASIDQESDIAKATWEPGTQYKQYTDRLQEPVHKKFGKMFRHAKKTIDANQQNLPGQVDSDAIGDLFRDQADPWRSIADIHVSEVWSLCKDFLSAAIDNSADEASANALKTEIIEEEMMEIRAQMHHKLDELMKPIKDSPPVTNNPRFQRYRVDTEPTPWSGREEYEVPETSEKALLRSMWVYYEVRKSCCVMGFV